jgi:chlorobactene glucosyltransferase
MLSLTPFAGLAWALPFAALARLVKQSPHVRDFPPTTGHLLSVIIPARNEAETIESVVLSVLASDYQPLELIVVDDRSTDDTLAILQTLSAADSRLRVVSGEPLPEGWLGKPWACHQGATAGKGELLLFIDADTNHSPALLGHAVAAITSDDIDLLTLTSEQLCVTFWERAIMPQIWVLLAMRYPPSAVNRARHAWQLVANGQFIMVNRSHYESYGGHWAVRGEVVEDLALAQMCFKSGGKLRMMWGEGLLRTRMYRSLGALVEGWSKNLFLGARRSAPGNGVLRALAPFGVMAAFAFWLAPIAALSLGIAPGAAAVAIACSLVFWVVMLVGMNIPPWYALVYPLGALAALLIVIRSAIRGGQRVEWRGRTYQVAEPS